MDEFNNMLVNSPSINCACLFSLDSRSFHGNGHMFRAMFDTLQDTPNFIVISETWNNKTNLDLRKLEGYSAFHIYLDSARGGGVRVFVRSGFSADKVAAL